MNRSAVLCGLCLAAMAAALASQPVEPRKAAVVETGSDSSRVCSAKVALTASSAPELNPAANPAPDTCKCSCGGENWSPGAIACMSGFKHRCVARGANGTNCGWDPVKRGSEQVRCDGGEHCK